MSRPIHVRTYLRQGGEFVPVESFRGSLPDEHYIEGAIELTIHGQPILTLGMWDLVDQLWAYLVEGIFELHERREFHTFFPDQPLEVRFKPLGGGRVLVRVGHGAEGGSATIDTQEFILAMAFSARHFFERMRTIAPTSASSYERVLRSLTRLATL